MLNSKAYTEVYYIVSLMSEEMKNKIPEKVLNNIKNRMDKEYEFYIDEEDIENLELLEDTEKILSVLYTDYLSTEEERQIILNKEKMLAGSKNKMTERNIEVKDVFSKKNEDDIQNNKKDLVNIETKKWYTKIFDFIKKLFNK